MIACDNVRYGCTVEVKLDALSYHLAECEHNPTRPVPCKQGCGLVIPKDELKVNIALLTKNQNITFCVQVKSSQK